MLQAVAEALTQAAIRLGTPALEVTAAASITLKADEPALAQLAALHGWSGEDGRLPWAAAAAADDGLRADTDTSGAPWGRLTPVHWHVGSDSVTLVDPAALALDEAESRALFEAVKPSFDAEGWTLLWGAPLRWHVRHEALGGLACASLDRAVGRNLDLWMSDAPEARRLRRMQVEAQMIWHDHPVNAAREEARALTVNSFWLDGCGAAQPRRPLAEAGVQLTESGHIRVNRVARTSVSNIYAAGDCTTFVPLASVAAMQGRTAIFHALGDTVIPLERRRITANIFTAPEIATVGRQEQDLATGAINGYVHKLPLAANARAKMMGISDGFVKIIAREGSGTVIGGVIVAPRASELIYPIAIAVERRLTVDQVSRVFAVFPSLTGSITDATRAMHLVNRDDDFFG